MTKLLILSILLCGLTACGKYSPSGKYIVTAKYKDSSITVKEYGLDKKNLFINQTFNITVDKKTFNSIEVGDEWCESPEATKAKP